MPATFQPSQPEPRLDEVSEMSAPLSDVEPETTATAARNQSKNQGSVKTKRSYKTVAPVKRRQLIELVNEILCVLKQQKMR